MPSIPLLLLLLCPAGSPRQPPPRRLPAHHAGYFHPDVFRHRRPGDPLLHHLHALERCRGKGDSAAAWGAAHGAGESFDSWGGTWLGGGKKGGVIIYFIIAVSSCSPCLAAAAGPQRSLSLLGAGSRAPALGFQGPGGGSSAPSLPRLLSPRGEEREQRWGDARSDPGCISVEELGGSWCPP